MYAAGKLPEGVKPFFEPQKPEEQLYDLRTDPRNMHNLAEDRKMRRVLKQMRSYLEEWLTLYPDYGQTPEPQEVMDRILQQRIQEYGF